MDGLPGYGVGGGSGPELGIRVKVATLRCTVARPAERAPEAPVLPLRGFPLEAQIIHGGFWQCCGEMGWQ